MKNHVREIIYFAVSVPLVAIIYADIIPLKYVVGVLACFVLYDLVMGGD